MSEVKQFPVLGLKYSIPWSVAEQVYIGYTRKYRTGQSIEKIAERGGFSVEELDLFVPNWKEQVSEITTLRAQLAKAQKEIEKRNSKTWCAYCGFEIDIDDEASTKISEHIMNCPKHPIRIYERHSEALEAENAALRERLKKVEEVYKMRDPSVSQMWQAIKNASAETDEK